MTKWEKSKKVGIKIAGCETPGGSERVAKAIDGVEKAFHDSHLALIDLTDFLNGFFVKEFLTPLLKEHMKITNKRQGELITESMEKFFRTLEMATDVREKTSNINEELYRATANFPPQKDGEGRRFCR
jgi:hypothetical protein